MADANSSCEISERGKRQHRRKQKAERMEKANAKLSTEMTTAQKFGSANYNWHQPGRFLGTWKSGAEI